ncbi:MAG: alpha/beta fold hydrolase [Gammaproteobacteria bacterium]|nr:alpha/beta fold hydrolase [Gammaproteobacteria bacterium]
MNAHKLTLGKKHHANRGSVPGMYPKPQSMMQALRTLPLALILIMVVGAAQARSIPYPLVFIHGLGEKSARWDHLQPALKALGLKPGGVLTRKALYRHPPPDDYDPQADFFLLEFDDNQSAVIDQVRELRLLLTRLHRDTDAPRFVLVGFSLGGLVSRAYLTKYLHRHYVEKLVTLAAPHQGSSWAYLHHAFQPIKAKCKDKGSIAQLMLHSVCTMVTRLEQTIGLRLDSPALFDLLPPEYDELGKPANLMAQLATTTHPGDVTYVAMVGTVEGPHSRNELEQLLSDLSTEMDRGDRALSAAKTKMINLLRNLVGLFSGNPIWVGGGDGGVSSQSQDLSQLAWFRTRTVRAWNPTPNKQASRLYEIRGLDRPLRIEVLKAHHLEQPKTFNTLYRALVDPPKLKMDKPPEWTFFGHRTIEGELHDILLQQDQLKLRRLDDHEAVLPTVLFDDDRRHFRFIDVALKEGMNTFELDYELDHGLAGKIEDRQYRFHIEYRPNKFIDALLRPISLLTLAVLFIFGTVLVRRRYHNKRQHP